MLKCLNVKMNKGFTILELMITIVVISIGVLGAYSVIQDILLSTAKSSNRLTATYLAQEGIELVRNERDTNWIRNNGWTDNILNINKTEEDILTHYDRMTTTSLDGDVLNVRIEVSWDIRGNSGIISIEERLYDWK